MKTLITTIILSLSIVAQAAGAVPDLGRYQVVSRDLGCGGQLVRTRYNEPGTNPIFAEVSTFALSSADDPILYIVWVRDRESAEEGNVVEIVLIRADGSEERLSWEELIERFASPCDLLKLPRRPL